MSWRARLRESLRLSFEELPAELLDRLGGGTVLIGLVSLYDVWLWRTRIMFPLLPALGLIAAGMLAMLLAGRLSKRDDPFDRDPIIWLGPTGLLGALIAVLGIWIWDWDLGESLLVAGTAGPIGVFLLLRWRVKERARKRDSRKRGLHKAAVYRVLVPAESIYFIAICDCGWVGRDRSGEETAFQDANRHTPTVSATVLDRP